MQWSDSEVAATLQIEATGATVADFWMWAYSSLAENATRGVFAEFIVALALGVTSSPRVEWDHADLRYRDRLIEVKSSADHQVWKQDKPSVIRFDVARKIGWDATTNQSAAFRSRAADIYIFCHYAGAAISAEVVRLGNWAFYVVACTALDAELGDQKSMGMTRLRTLAQPVAHEAIRSEVDKLVV